MESVAGDSGSGEKNGVTTQEVIREIEEAIAEAIDDPQAKTAWESIPHKGYRPTAVELIAYLSETVSFEG